MELIGLSEVVQAVLPLGLYDSVDPVKFELYVADRNAIWRHFQISKGETYHDPLEFWRRLCHHTQIIMPLLRYNSWLTNEL
jgi:hypothetical protein